MAGRSGRYRMNAQVVRCSGYRTRQAYSSSSRPAAGGTARDRFSGTRCARDRTRLRESESLTRWQVDRGRASRGLLRGIRIREIWVAPRSGGTPRTLVDELQAARCPAADRLLGWTHRVACCIATAMRSGASTLDGVRT